MDKFLGKDHEKMAAMWRKKSLKYPRYRTSTTNIEDRVMQIVKEDGIRFENRTVLDIGCGTGLYTIRAAKEAKSVTGLDISEEMLEIFRQDASAEGLNNIETITAPWDTFDTGGRKWDIVMSTLTPAMQDDDDFSKAVFSASEAVFFLGWVGKRQAEPIISILDTYESEKRTNSAVRMKNWLDANQIQYKTHYLDDIKDEAMSFDDALSLCTDDLELRSINVPENELKQALVPFCGEDGIVRFKIFCKFELITSKLMYRHTL